LVPFNNVSVPKMGAVLDNLDRSFTVSLRLV
jgi:hypothetical protein